MHWKSWFVVALFVASTLGHSMPAWPDQFRLLKLDGYHLKWGEGKFHSGARITYRIVDRSTAFPGGINCPLLDPIKGLLKRAGLQQDDFAAELRTAFDLWERAANVRFVEAIDMSSPDLLIGAQRLPRGIAYTGLNYGRGDHQYAIARIRKAAICLNPELVWKITVGARSRGYSIRRVLAHEIGHVIGLDHSGLNGQIMGYEYDEGLTVLREGDIEGAVRLYGPPSIGGPFEASN